MFSVRWAAAAALTLSLAATAAGAATCIGSCGVITGANGDVTAAPGGLSYSWISTNRGVTSAGQIGPAGGTNGSSLTTTAFVAANGQTLSFNFNFVTSDGQDPGNRVSGFVYQDYAYAQLINLDTNAVTTIFTARTEPTGTIVPGSSLPPVDPGVTLSPSSAPIVLGSGAGGGPIWSPLGADSGQCYGPGCGLTGWIGSSFVVPTAGNYQVVFGVSNWADTLYQTGLAVSGLNIGGATIDDGASGSGVPEPTAWALMVVGFGLVGAALRRHEARVAA